MAKRSRKKKNERSDFAKVRLKVGRRVPKCLNETRISLATGKIVVREQLLQVDLEDGRQAIADAAASVGGALVVKKLRSTQLDERIAAANKLARWLASASCASATDARQLFTFNELSEYLAPCLRDPTSSELRAAARRVFSGLLDRGQLGRVPAYRPVLFHALRASWCHLDAEVQRDSVDLLAMLLELAPDVVAEFAAEICRLFCQLRQRTTVTAAVTGAAGISTTSMRSRKQLLALAECAGRFAELLLRTRAAAAATGGDADDAANVDVVECLGDFDLNEAAWSWQRLSWRCETAAQRQLLLDDVSDVPDSDVSDEPCTGGDGPATKEFEASLAGLVKELFPADFAGRVAGAAAHAELLTLARCLRSLLAMHFWRPAGCDCGHADLQASSRNKRPPATCCGLAVSDLLATTLCPLFPLNVLSCELSSGGSISKKKRRGKRGGKDALRDAAGKAKELNSMLVECALICGPALEAALDGAAAADDFVLSAYKFLAAQYSAGAAIPAGDAEFWLAASRRTVLRHPQARISRLFLAFFADSLRHGRFERPQPAAQFLVQVACARGSPSSDPLDFLPGCLVEQFDAARLHMLPTLAEAEAGSLEAATSAVRGLLMLMSRRYPGAEAAALGASDRLVRYCPDRLLRRSLSAALALCA